MRCMVKCRLIFLSYIMRKPVSGTDTPINLDYDVVF